MKITNNKVAPITKKRKMLIAAAKFYARYLKIENYDVTVNIVFKYDLSKCFKIHAEVERINERRLNLNIDADIALEMGYQIMAHEMVHVKQYIKGELAEDAEGFQLWKGKHVKDSLVYYKQPWEREAMRKQVIMMYAFIEFLEKQNV